jgi:hypothetical protein
MIKSVTRAGNPVDYAGNKGDVVQPERKMAVMTKRVMLMDPFLPRNNVARIK